ncbi:MAG: hypothetical protein M1830_005439 [Pleopsidium flavum]|nr:MAG: hypothetical protein M1830_005439 [Pleopsidium flavum]
MPAIGPGQKAALSEAYAASVSLLPFSLRGEFLVIGGSSLVILGSKRNTEDVDFAVSAAALFAFEEAAHNDPRFSKGAVAEWTYSCQGEGIKDVKVPLEFLQMGGGFAPSIKVVKPVGEGFRAGMGELVRMKANTYMARGEDKDLEDFCFLLDKMKETGEGFEGVELEDEDLESMEATAADCGRRHSDLFKELFGKAGR